MCPVNEFEECEGCGEANDDVDLVEDEEEYRVNHMVVMRFLCGECA